MNAVFFIVFFIFSVQAHANHTKIDKDLINLMSSLNNNVIGINFLKEHKYEMAIEFFISKIENNNLFPESNTLVFSEKLY